MSLITTLTWVTLGPLILMAVVLCAAFVLIPLADRRQPRVTHWEPGGPWLPQTRGDDDTEWLDLVGAEIAAWPTDGGLSHGR